MRRWHVENKVTSSSSSGAIGLRIEEHQNGVLLLIDTAAGTFNTWHPSFKAAVDEANEMFQVTPDEWRAGAAVTR